MDIIKKNAETFKVLGGMAIGLVTICMWLNSQFNEVNQHIGGVERRIDAIENRLVRIETVLVMRGIMPEGLAAKTEKVKE